MYKNIDELGEKLARSYARYNKKDCLQVTLSEPGQMLGFASLAGKPGVITLGLSALQTASVPEGSELRNDTVEQDSSDDGYSQKETEAVSKIQVFWRTRISHLRRHRQYLRTIKAQLISKHIALYKLCSAALPIRACLLSEGVEVHLSLTSAREKLAASRKKIMVCVMKIEASDDQAEILQDLMHEAAQAETRLRDVAASMSEEVLMEVLKENDIVSIQGILEDMRSAVQEAEEVIASTHEAVKKL